MYIISDMSVEVDKKCRSVLIVEDEEGIRETIKMALELEGYEVFVASNGREGLELIPKIPRPCLILLDLMMPVMNGWEFAEQITNDVMLATIPIVLVTAYGDRANEVTSKGIIKKPVDLEILYSTVSKWCDGSTS